MSICTEQVSASAMVLQMCPRTWLRQSLVISVSTWPQAAVISDISTVAMFATALRWMKVLVSHRYATIKDKL